MSETISKSGRSIEDRQADAATALASLAKWEHCNHDAAGAVHDFDGEIHDNVEAGRVPEFVWSGGNERVIDYVWQVFCETAAKAIFMPEDELAEALVDAEQTLKNGTGKPRSSDGSKGQWRAYHRTRVRTYDWFLNGGDDE